MSFTDPNGAGVYGFISSPAMVCPGMTYNDILSSGSVKSRLNNFFNPLALADTSATKGSASCALPIVGAFPSPGPGLPPSPSNWLRQSTKHSAGARAIQLGYLNCQEDSRRRHS